MADNYLENKFEEFRKKSTSKKPVASLGTLLRRNRSYRGYDKSREVTAAELRRIVDVCTRIPSGRNQQVLRFKLLTRTTGADRMQDTGHIRESYDRKNKRGHCQNSVHDKIPLQ